MKETHIECAGAGKTYGIATKIVEMIGYCPEDKKIYAITYTNYAVSQIKDEILKHIHYIPDQVIIDTVHGFLLEQIIYPFSPYIKNIAIHTCSIEKLSTNESWKSKRIKALKDAGIIHSEAVTKYAKSIIVPQAGDNKKVKQRKEIAMQYLNSDLFCLFVDESQDMDKEFFDIMKVLISRIEHYYFVGDPNQDLWGRKQYELFLDFVAANYGIEPISKLVTRRLPQTVIPLCNKILKTEFQITSCNEAQGVVEYIFVSELSDTERMILSADETFAMIKGKTDSFVTKSEKVITLPHEFKETLKEHFELFDFDAVVMTAIEIIKQNGLTKFLRDNNIYIDKTTYAKIASQFGSIEKGLVHVHSIHNLKGLEKETVYFLVCNSLLEILLGFKNDYNKETNLLYVALTRTKSRILLIILDDNTTKKSIEAYDVDIRNLLNKMGIFHANVHTWF